MSRLIVSTVGTSLKFNAQKTGIELSDSKSIQAFLSADPYRASAEANALLRLDQPGDELVFLHSDTPDGAACSAALSTYFQGQGHAARNE